MMDLSSAEWRKSGRSSHEGGECVEVAGLVTGVAVRDSKDPDGPKLMFAVEEWRAFFQAVKTGEHDLA